MMIHVILAPNLAPNLAPTADSRATFDDDAVEDAGERTYMSRRR
jgi:hypothetical protein